MSESYNYTFSYGLSLEVKALDSQASGPMFNLWTGSIIFVI